MKFSIDIQQDIAILDLRWEPLSMEKYNKKD
jgi:hypothetical protein